AVVMSGSSSPSNEALLTELDRVVKETLAYFDGAGRSTSARVDRWQARDILMHFIYFHDATAWDAGRGARWSAVALAGRRRHDQRGVPTAPRARELRRAPGAGAA